jgi:hypothetical protein
MRERPDPPGFFGKPGTVQAMSRGATTASMKTAGIASLWNQQIAGIFKRVANFTNFVRAPS